MTGPDDTAPLALGRPLRDDDADGLRALVASCYAEYEGCLFDRDGYDADLGAYATHLGAHGGQGRVVVDRGAIVACVGMIPRGAPMNPAHAEVKRLYVARAARGRGLGQALVGWAVEEARAAGAAGIEAWSDTRFLDAHRLYRRLGFDPLGVDRSLQDISNSIEHGFLRRLA